MNIRGFVKKWLFPRAGQEERLEFRKVIMDNKMKDENGKENGQ